MAAAWRRVDPARLQGPACRKDTMFWLLFERQLISRTWEYIDGDNEQSRGAAHLGSHTRADPASGQALSRQRQHFGIHPFG